MVFSSLLFIYLFLALNLLFCWLAGPKYRNMVQLLFSLVFYSWGGPRYLLLLVGETAVSWFTAGMIDRQPLYSGAGRRKRKFYMVLECVVMLGLLGIFKYLGFVLGTLKALTGMPENVPQIVLPIGISFYTFQLLSYVIDVYRDEVPAQRSFLKLLLYSSLFHQCIAGPIVRYATVADEIDNRHATTADVFYGVRRFSVGLAKKAILANGCAACVRDLLPEGVEALQTQSPAGMWLGVFFYAMQVYLDFSAYSDMAIGMGRMAGFHYLENFNYPYVARSVQDFWRRWHISLSTFFRDYVYIPLGGSRCSTLCQIRNMFVVWFLTGLWHGASWNYVLWGLYFLVFLLIDRYILKDRLPRLIGNLYSMLVVHFSWVIFRYPDLNEAAAVFKGMFGIGNRGATNLQAMTVLSSNLFFMIVCLVACTPLGHILHEKLTELSRRNRFVSFVYHLFDAMVPAVLLVLSTLSLVGDSYDPFLYFNF